MNFYVKQLLQLFLISVGIYLLLLLLVTTTSMQSYYSLEGIALFFVLTTWGVVAALKKVHELAEDKVGFAFMGLILLKALASFVFLIPGFFSSLKPTFSSILFFFIPYFIFLSYEVLVAIKILNNNK